MEMAGEIATLKRPKLMEFLLDKKVSLNEEKQRLQERLKQIDKELYELEPNVFTVTDERSGRTFKLKRNPYELSIEYPKVHPVTGQRLYGKTEHWTGTGFNSIATTMDTNFPDKECVKEKERFDGYYQLYYAGKGWSKPGYYWYDVSSDYDPVHYVETKIPKKR